MIRFILYALVVYIIFKLARTVAKVFLSSKKNGTNPTNFTKPKQKKSTIDKKDIIEAEFEEIKENESKTD